MLDPTFFKAYHALGAGYKGGLYRRRIVDNGQTSEGLTAQLWASAALTALEMAPIGSEEAQQSREAVELVQAAFAGNYQNVVERANGCDTFVKWLNAHNQMMAARRANRSMRS